MLSEKYIIGFFETKVSEYIQLTQDKDSYPILKLLKTAKEMLQVFERGGRVAFVGNGGSAAEAMHIAAEFTGKCVIDHKPLSVLCLNESQSSITAIANDFGVDKIFSRQVEAHLREGDMLIALSTSGKSANITEALISGKKLNVNAKLWMGNFDPVIRGVDVWKVPSSSTPRIQEIHLFWGHILAELIETLVQEI